MENLQHAHKHLAAGMKSLNKAIGSGGDVGVNLINLVKASGDEDNDYIALFQEMMELPIPEIKKRLKEISEAFTGKESSCFTLVNAMLNGPKKDDDDDDHTLNEEDHQRIQLIMKRLALRAKKDPLATIGGGLGLDAYLTIFERFFEGVPETPLIQLETDDFFTFVYGNSSMAAGDRGAGRTPGFPRVVMWIDDGKSVQPGTMKCKRLEMCGLKISKPQPLNYLEEYMTRVYRLSKADKDAFVQLLSRELKKPGSPAPIASAAVDPDVVAPAAVVPAPIAADVVAPLVAATAFELESIPETDEESCDDLYTKQAKNAAEANKRAVSGSTETFTQKRQRKRMQGGGTRRGGRTVNVFIPGSDSEEEEPYAGDPLILTLTYSYSYLLL